MRYKKDILKENYNNPYYPKKEIKINKTAILFVIFFVLIFYWGYLVFYSPCFKIKNVYVNDLEYIEKNEIIDIVYERMKRRKFFIFKEDKIFFINKKELKEEFENKFLIDEVKINNLGLNILDIFIKERISCFTWITNDKYYYLDIEGNIKNEIFPNEANRNFPIIYDGNNKEIFLDDGNRNVIEKKEITKLIKIIEEINKNTDFEIISFKYFNGNTREVYAKTNKGYEIYFDLKKDIAEQLEKLYILLEQGFNNMEVPLEYIDLRFLERVYYK
ncbi:MAG: hypothetical protein V1891_04505 [bacterium]